jgi:hypothetical protein
MVQTNFRLFAPENTTQNVRGTNLGAGISDSDNGPLIEQSLTTPWVINPVVSWLDYRCWIEVHLDAGIVLHKILPQAAQDVDTLAIALADPTSPTIKPNPPAIQPASLGTVDLDQFKGSQNPQDPGAINLKSVGTYKDFTQRMATSTYRFVLRGYGLRAGYQVPVPGLISVAGIPAIPDGKQWSLGNPLVGAYGAVPVFYNEWELWYLVSVPPRYQQKPPPNLAQHVTADQQLPNGIQVPYSQTDQNSTPGPVEPPNPGNDPNQGIVQG